MKTHHVLVVLALASFAGSLPDASAQDKSWKGESVLYTKPAKDIKFSDAFDGKKASFELSGIIPMQVREERAARLRIFDGRREGWVDKTDFVLLREASDYFDNLVQANPKD